MKLNLNIVLNPVLRQFFIGVIVSFTYLHVGLNLAWISPVIAKLRDGNQTTLDEPLSESNAAWITSIAFLSGCCGLFFASYLSNGLGRKLSLILVCIPRLVMCILNIFATSVWMLILARTLNGISDVVISLAPTYTSELASKEIRGAMGMISPIMSGVGIMMMLSFGPYTSYVTLQIINACIIFATSVPLIFLPESPYFLYSKGKQEESIKILTYLRGSATSAHEEYKDYSLIKDVKISKKQLFHDKITLKTLGKIIILAIGTQAMGYNILMLYLQTIFEMTNTNVSPEMSSTISGVIQLFACICTTLLTDRFGRKPLLVSSAIGFCIGMFGLGTFFKLTENKTETTGFLDYLPLISIMLIIFCNNFGTGSLIYTVTAELFEGPVRAYGVSLSVFTGCMLTFLGSRYFYVFINGIGPAAIYWTCSGCCVATCLFIWLCLPETKGKPFSQIQKELGRVESDSP